MLGWYYTGSLLYLGLVTCLVLSINDHDDPKSVAKTTLRRLSKLLGALALLGLVVQALS
ncbi:MAG: hypothetical protein V2A74_07605 [bacterium]